MTLGGEFTGGESSLLASAGSEVYMEDVFMSFRKYCRGMSQHELLD